MTKPMNDLLTVRARTTAPSREWITRAGREARRIAHNVSELNHRAVDLRVDNGANPF